MAKEIFIGIPKLPNEYQQIEYLESTGMQYIDTGVSGNAIGTYEIKFNMLGEGYQNYEMYFAGPLSAQVPKLYLNGDAAIVADTGTAAYSLFTKDNNPHIIKITNTEILCDNIVKATYEAKPWGDQSFWLFNAAGQPSLYSTMRLYYLKMYSDGVLVRDYIPCYRKEDNISGLYDIVNNIFYENEGTGNFITGKTIKGTARKVKEMFIGVPLKLPNEYQQVKYLESTGNQWINTGVPAFSKTRSEIDVEFTHMTGQGDYSFYNGHMRETKLASISHAFGSYYYGATGFTTLEWDTIYDGTEGWDYDYERHVLFLDGKTGEYGLLDGSFTGSGLIEDTEYLEGEYLYLFACNQYDRYGDWVGATYKAYEKVYGAKYYLDGILVRDFIPCVRKSDNKPGMYDLINNQFYINQGTEEFLIGEKITSARKVKKAFLGINGIAKQIYKLITKRWVLKTGDYLPKFVEGDFSAEGFASKEGITITYGNASNVSQDNTEAWKAFDTDPSTYWYARHAAGNGSVEDGWVVIDCGPGFKPSKITMRFGADSTSGDPYYLYASEDNVTWDLVWSTTVVSEDSIYVKDFNITLEETSKVYRYLRPTWENSKSGILDKADFYNFQILEWYEEEEIND